MIGHPAQETAFYGLYLSGHGNSCTLEGRLGLSGHLPRRDHQDLYLFTSNWTANPHFLSNKGSILRTFPVAFKTSPGFFP